MTQRQPSSPDGNVQRGDLIALATEVGNLREPIHAVVRLMRRTSIAQAGVAGILVLTSGLLLGHACLSASRVADVVARLDETTRLLETVREQGEQTSRKVEDVRDDVAEVKADQPVVEIRSADAGAGKRPGKPTAVIIVRPATAKADAGAPSIELPVSLPEGSRVEDAGAP